MTPLDYIITGVDGLTLSFAIWLAYRWAKAGDAKDAALAEAKAATAAKDEFDKANVILTENLRLTMAELASANAQLARTQAKDNAAAEEKTHALETDLAAHPDRAGDAVTQLLAGHVTADGAIVAPADGAGHAVAPAVQPAAAAQADRVHRDP